MGFKGRRLQKVNKHMLAYGKELQKVVFTSSGELSKASNKEREVKQWIYLFGINSWFQHYLDEKGNWREANC